jgi:hypothetical protein
MAEIERDALIENPQVKEQLLTLWRNAPVDGEAAAWIVYLTKPEPRYYFISWERGYSSHATYKGKPPAGTVAQIHTHPTKLSPKPSTSGGDGKGDWGVASQCGVPVYVVSVWAIWRVDPDQSAPKLVQVAKDWL